MTRANLSTLGLAAVLGLGLAPGAAGEGLPAPISVDSEGSTGVEVSAGGAWSAVHLFGGVHDAGRHTAIVDVQVIRTFKVGETWALDWRVGIVPMEMQTTELIGGDSTGLLGGPPGRSLNDSVYGAGLDPIGFGIRSRRGDWRPYATARGGFRVFQSPVPAPQGSRFNFAATIGVGLQRRIGHTKWLSVGLDLHHVSNGGIQDYNPGINQLVLNIGCASMR